MSRVSMLITVSSRKKISEFVKLYEKKHESKSISKGITLKSDTDDVEYLFVIIKKISGDIARSLRDKGIKCNVISLTLKDENFNVTNRQRQISSTDLYQEIAETAILLLRENYSKATKIRMITVSVVVENCINEQIKFDSFFNVQSKKNEKIEKATMVLDSITKKYGEDKINFASIFTKK